MDDWELEILAAIMTLELNGITADINWKMVKMKIWVFFNLINTRVKKINAGAPIFNGNGDNIGKWNVWVAIAGHEGGPYPSMKDVLAEDKNAGRHGWDRNNYSKQTDALKRLAGSMGNDESDQYNPLYNDVLSAVTEVESDWYLYGSGSGADLSQGAISFQDFDPTPEGLAAKVGLLVYLWDFSPTVQKGTSFR